ncbi:MAG: HAD family phosphatase [Pseudomonadota bacterium]
MFSAVMFDLGNVLVDWSPRDFFIENGYAPSQADELLTGPVSLAWHSRSDAGLPMAENVRQRILEYPDHEPALTLYLERWQETIRGPIDGSVACLEALAQQGVPLYAVTNFPADPYPTFFARFEFMTLFRDVLVSGDVGLKKPDPRIFALAADRFNVAPGRTLFIDDRRENCDAAAALGFQCHHFTTPSRLRDHLTEARLI